MIIPAAMMGLPWNQTVLISFKRTLQTLNTRSLFSSVSSTITLVYTIKLTTEVITTASQSKGKITGNKELEAKKRGRPKAWDTQETKSRLASIFPLISWRDGKCSVNSGAQNNKFNGFPGSLWYAIEKNILTKGKSDRLGKKELHTCVAYEDWAHVQPSQALLFFSVPSQQ